MVHIQHKINRYSNQNGSLRLILRRELCSFLFRDCFHAGFYRVNYDMDNWMALIKQLHEAPVEIHVLNRAQLIYDAFHLAMAGQLDFTVPIHLAEYLPNENSTIPWYSALRCFSIIKQKVVLSVNLQVNI